MGAFFLSAYPEDTSITVLGTSTPIVNSSLFSSLAQFDTLVAVPWAVGIMLTAIAICLLVAAGVSWNATRVRPLEVLRYE